MSWTIGGVSLWPGLARRTLMIADRRSRFTWAITWAAATWSSIQMARRSTEKNSRRTERRVLAPSRGSDIGSLDMNEMRRAVSTITLLVITPRGWDDGRVATCLA